MLGACTGVSVGEPNPATMPGVSGPILVAAMADEAIYPIHDPVHRRIWLTKAELELVDTATFQRLRRVSQLGLADYVFPGATRTRFSHSLGALHIMGELLSVQKGKLAEHLANAADIDWRAMRLAALLHDIGHLPFSHPTEVAYEQLKREPVRGFADDLLDRAAAFPQSVTKSHEAVATEMLADSESEIYHVLATHLPHATISMIGQLIRGRATRSAVASALVSSDLDADRLDYVMRDADSAGFVYGLIDLDYLLENVEVAPTAGGIDVLATNARHGTGALEHYLLARSFVYSQLVNHKTVAAAELLLRATLIQTLREAHSYKWPILPVDSDEVKKWFSERRFHRLTDGYVLSSLGFAAYETGGGASETLRELVQRLLRRRLPKVAYVHAALRGANEQRPAQMDALQRLVATTGGKAELAQKASALGPVTVSPTEFCLVQRDEKILDQYREPEHQDGVIAAATGAMVAVDTDTGPEAVPLASRADSLLAPLEGHVRDLQFVFVLEDLDLPSKAKPRTEQLKKALADEGFV
jgi:HD superfamily phosphohydrolase